MILTEKIEIKNDLDDCDDDCLNCPDCKECDDCDCTGCDDDECEFSSSSKQTVNCKIQMKYK